MRAAACSRTSATNISTSSSKLMDVRIVKADHDQITVFTSSGTQLVGTQAGVLSSSPTGTITAAQAVEFRPVARAGSAP